MKPYILALLATLVQTMCYSQTLKSLRGSKWWLQGIEECSDNLVFETNNRYSILNGCYGWDVRNPWIEKGTWQLNADQTKLILTKRKFANNYLPYGEGDKVELKIIKLSDSVLIIKSDQTTDVYHRSRE